MNELFNKLGLKIENGLYITEEKKWYGIFSKRIEEFFENITKPDAFFCINNKPLILFYNFKNRKSADKKNIFKNIWNFNEIPIVFMVYNDSVEIYNGFKYLTENSELAKIIQVKEEHFNYYNLVTGKIWNEFNEEFNYKNRIDYYLLENIKETRNILINDCKLTTELANKLIGKCIFTRYLIDRKVKLDYLENEYISNDDFIKILKNKEKTKNFFNYLQSKFNGDLFNIHNFEYSFDENVLEILIHLISGSKITDKYKLRSLFDVYDFSVIPVEFISNVYELFIGKENQAKEGAYYTPIFLVDYILSQTIEQYFKDNPKEYNCKILDPACGSGIFLVEAYRKIIKQFEKLNPNIKNDGEKYKNALIKLAKDNLFGIDKDENAVSVAAFSIYLTMLHYQTPPDIATFKFPDLKECNFLSGDFFDPKFENKESLKDIKFIIGNPPWKRGENREKKPFFCEYIEKRKKTENSDIEISNKQIAQAFILRVSEFSDENTQCALIVTSKIFYNLNGEKFRKYLLDNYFINKVFELAPVRREIFNNSNDTAIAPAAIIFYKYAHEKNTDNNIIEHISLKPTRFFSMFKFFSIQRNDYKEVIQKRLKEYDYLWKVLVYGNYLDFNFIKRLKKDFKTIRNSLTEEKKVFLGEGMMIGGGDKNDVSEYKNKPFINPQKNIFEFFFIDLKLDSFLFDYVHRKRTKELFTPPILLISRSLNQNLLPKSAILYKEAIYTNAFTGVKIQNLSKLKLFNVFMVSLLNSYYTLQTVSSAGIEREQIHDEEKWDIPYTENNKLIELVTTIEQLKIKEFEEQNNKILLSKITNKESDKKMKELDEEVLESFNLSEEEKALVDYSVNITIPLIMKHKNYEKTVLAPLKSNDKILTEYTDVFFKRFEPLFNGIGFNLSVKIWINDDIIGMFFQEISIQETLDEKIEIITSKTTNDILLKIYSLGIDKITDRLFIQKDIRGFEEYGFYIIKPNEKRLWHKAIAYLDMYEFADAILSSNEEESND